MTAEEQRIAVAEWCGWKKIPIPQKAYFDWSVEPEPKTYWEECEKTQLPDYLNDLNAIHEATMHAAEIEGTKFQALFQLRLQEVVERRRRDLNREQIGWWMNNATAAQRCEALLRTIGKWKGDK